MHSKILDYEQGKLNSSQTLQLFSELIKSNLLFQLSDQYIRTARVFINLGFISNDGKILKR